MILCYPFFCSARNEGGSMSHVFDFTTDISIRVIYDLYEHAFFVLERGVFLSFLLAEIYCKGPAMR